MQYYSFCILLAVLGLLSSCQHEHNDHIDLNLKGHVKELRLKRYKAVIESGKVAKGRLVSRNLDKPQLYEYEGLPANSKVKFGKKKEMQEVEIYDNRDLLHSKIVLKDTLFEMYTSQGILVANILVDDRWFPNRMQVYRTTGELLERTAIVYDKDKPFDRVHKEYNQDGQLMATTTYKFDENNRLKVVDTQVKKRSYHRLKEEHRIETISYDEYNHPSQVTIKEGGNIQTINITYILDKQNNWVQSIESVDGTPTRLIERELVYY